MKFATKNKRNILVVIIAIVILVFIVFSFLAKKFTLKIEFERDANKTKFNLEISSVIMYLVGISMMKYKKKESKIRKEKN
ncbi:hypothetical protein BBF96_03245 [Anoxybacter fermentans]|uniref:Uncharacterized protein n=1 Tax=Anoxybacter fermentans TaxID=1323375 RepID=A0A3S9SW69_9FIRM|nr:hypothetical protein [Anoxybacter fermentans]AZR72480.1 hypothetical protein BBF96_03245 [Anoxybacter fermentans]